MRWSSLGLQGPNGPVQPVAILCRREPLQPIYGWGMVAQLPHAGVVR